MRTPRSIAALLLLVLVGTGCSSTTEGGPDRAPETPSSATTDPTTDPTTDTTAGATGEEQGSAALRACDLLAPADYERFIRPALRASATEAHGLDTELGSLNTCTVSSGPYPLFRFGYSTDPDAWATIERRTRPQERLGGGDKVLRKSWDLFRRKREEVPNLADEAFLTEGFGENVLYALQDGVSYRLEPDGLAGREGTVGDYIAVMIVLLDNASAGVDREPVQLPPQCPAADSPEVVDVLGEVTYAFGSAYQGKAPSCAYTAQDGRRLGVGSTIYPTAALFDREVIRPEEREGMTLLDPLPGRTAGIERDGRNWVFHAALPGRLETFGARTGSISWGRRPGGAVDRAAFLAFVDAYRALASEQLGVDY